MMQPVKNIFNMITPVQHFARSTTSFEGWQQCRLLEPVVSPVSQVGFCAPTDSLSVCVIYGHCDMCNRVTLVTNQTFKFHQQTKEAGATQTSASGLDLGCPTASTGFH
jgi:hypothetical protein